MYSFTLDYQNVRLDPASAYKWDALNETEFLSKVFSLMNAKMGQSFQEYNFFVFSSSDSDITPASAAINLPNKVLFFISDESSNSDSINSVLKLQHCYHAIFKSYLPCELPNTNVNPFQIGYVKGLPQYDVIPSRLRKTDIFFAGNLNNNRIALYLATNPNSGIPSFFLVKPSHPTGQTQASRADT
jgi:hypothetical protein